MNNLQTLQQNDGVKKVEEMIEAVLLRNTNDIETLEKAKANNLEIDLSNKVYSTTRYLNMIQVMARLGYSAGSEVGLIIVALSIGDTLKDMELNKQFLVKGTNKVDMFKMRKVFKEIGQGNKVGYDRVFKKDMFLDITDVFGRKTFMLLALKKHVLEFTKQIASIGELYQEDLVNIGKDLGIIATVISEIEIDSAKKPWLKEGLPEVSSYMAEHMNLKSRKLEILDNFAQIVESVKDRKNKKDIKFKSRIAEDGIPLFDFDNEWEKTQKAIMNSPKYKNSDKNEQAKMLYGAKNYLLNSCHIVDPLSEFAQALHDQQSKNIYEIVELYKSNNDKLFDCFNKKYEGEKNVASKKVRYMAIKVIKMINYIFANNKEISLPKLEEACKDYRNMLYTYGDKLGFAAHETFCICADAGWYSIRFNVETGRKEFFRKDNYSFKAMEMLFSNELKCFFNPKVMRKEVSVELPEEIFEIENAIYHGMTLQFNDGEALICDSEEYGELYAFRTDVDDYTGSVVIEVNEEGYVIFREEFQAFNFDKVEFILFDSIADASNSESRIDKETIESLRQASTTNNIDAFAYKYEKCEFKDEDVNVHEIVIDMFNKFITLAAESTEDSKFEIFTGGNKYAYIQKDRDKGYMIGHVYDSCVSTSISKAKSVKAHTTGIGSVIIINK